MVITLIDVRFGGKPDIALRHPNVRFMTQSGYSEVDAGISFMSGHRGGLTPKTGPFQKVDES